MKIYFGKSALMGVALLCSGIATDAQAGAINPAVSFTSVGSDGTNGEWSLGFKFSTNAPLGVDALGIFDDGGNAGSVHAVGIFDSSGNLLASTDITQGSNYSNFFDWASITTLNLAANTSYYIAEETGSSNYSYSNGGFSVNPDITFIEDAYVSSSTLAFPNSTGGGTDQYFGPDFSIAAASAVPEPSSLPILLAGLGMIGGAFYFGRKKVAAAKA